MRHGTRHTSRQLRPALLALLLLPLVGACGGGSGCYDGWIGVETCFWDAWGNYVCVGSDPYAYDYDPWYKQDALHPDSCGFLRWADGANDFLVLDANDDVVRFDALPPHVMLVGPTRVTDVEAMGDGTLLWRGAPLGRVALVRAQGDAPLAALVGADGTLLDLVRRDGALSLLGTSLRTPLLGAARADGPACDAAPAAEVPVGLGLAASRDADEWSDLGTEAVTLADAL